MSEGESEKSRGLTFAEKQMLRHGWEPGKGLGRHEDGMSEPIKVKLKCDKGGIGHKLGSQFTFNWWDHVFNKASSNLSVEADQNGITVKKIDHEEEGMISNKRPLKASLSKQAKQYGCFVKSATLLSGKEQLEKSASSSDNSSDSEDDDDEKLDLSSATGLSDAELMKICGGRTAHKGARHGLTMSAKLARLEQQEQEFLAKYSGKAASVATYTETTAGPTPQSPSNENSVPNKTKQKKNKQKTSEAGEIQERVTNGETNGAEISSDGGERKKKKTSKERGDADAAEAPVEMAAEDRTIEKTKSKKKKKKKHTCDQETGQSNESKCQENSQGAVTMSTETVAEHAVDTDVEHGNALKKKKKKKKRQQDSNENLLEVENVDNSVVVNGHDAHPTHECEERDEVLVVKEQGNVDQQIGAELDSKQKKKKKKRSKNTVDVSSISEEVMEKVVTGEEVPDVTGAQEGMDRTSKKDKKRKAEGGDGESVTPDHSTTMKKKKKKRKDENC